MYVCERISALLGEGGKPIVVFDGDRSYEAKQATQEKRAKKREEALAVPEAHRTAATWRAAAAPQEPMIRAIMAWCIQQDVPIVVAAYEADQQLVEMQQSGLIDTILVSSDDSDLIMYGGTDCLYSYNAVEHG